MPGGFRSGRQADSALRDAGASLRDAYCRDGAADPGRERARGQTLRRRRVRPKSEATPLEMSAALLSKITGKPVKRHVTREQVFLHSRARHQFLRGDDPRRQKDGTMIALKNKAILDGGAYNSFGIATVYYSGSLLGGPYKLKAMKYDGSRSIPKSLFAALRGATAA